MNRTKRLFFQILLWLFLWLILWYQRLWELYFIFDNLFVFFAQIALLCLLIYYSAPKFLFKKKYVVFIIISLVAISLLIYTSGFFDKDLPYSLGPPSSPMGSPPPNHFGKTAQRAPINLIMMLLAFVIGTVIELIAFTKKKEEEIMLNKNENLQTELKLLKSQINPHFLFNSLNNIYALSEIDKTKTQQSISYLSDMLRYVLYECEQRFVPIKNEIIYIENYIRLFSLKSSKTYPIEIRFNSVNANIQIAPMLLIPFVENAFKHSNVEKIKDTFIKISLDTTEDVIIFKIENTIASATVTKDSVGGIGIENVKRRLALLYPNKHQLIINENDGVFKVELKLDTYV